MTENMDSLFHHYSSDRFDFTVQKCNLGEHFFDDDDPRIRITTDRWGDEIIIVGFTDAINISDPLSPEKIKISGRIIGLRIRDHCLSSWLPKNIDQEEYPVYVSPPFKHPDYLAQIKQEKAKTKEKKILYRREKKERKKAERIAAKERLLSSSSLT